MDTIGWALYILHAVLFLSCCEPISFRLASWLTDARHPGCCWLVHSQTTTFPCSTTIKLQLVGALQHFRSMCLLVHTCTAFPTLPPNVSFAPSPLVMPWFLPWFFLQRSHQMPQVKVHAGNLQMTGQSLLTQGALPARNVSCKKLESGICSSNIVYYKQPNILYYKCIEK